jgi:hypothetical protein
MREVVEHLGAEVRRVRERLAAVADVAGQLDRVGAAGLGLDERRVRGAVLMMRKAADFLERAHESLAGPDPAERNGEHTPGRRFKR